MPYDGSAIGLEYSSAAEAYGGASEAQLSAVARRVVMDMAIDGVISSTQIAEISPRAAAGNAEAQAQPWAIGQSIKAAVMHPVTTVEQDIAGRLAEADRLESKGDQMVADELRIRVMMDWSTAVG